MKFSIDVEATPEEMRAFLGLPDVRPLHEDMVKLMQERMRAGVEGYDPVSLMAEMLPKGMQGVEAMQRMFWEGLSRGWGGAPSHDADQKKD